MQSEALHADLKTEAEIATASDHELATLAAVKLYSRGVGWGLFISSSLIMMGYDGKLMATFYAAPSFMKTYGVEDSKGTYQIPAPWQSGITNASNAGQIIGLIIGGSLSERFGFRKTMLGAAAFMCCTLFAYVFASSLSIFVVGQILTGQSHAPTASRKFSDFSQESRWAFSRALPQSMLLSLCRLVSVVI